MAEGLLRHLGGDAYEVHSAGIVQSHLRAETVEAMREIGIDISRQWSKTADVYAGQDFDLVVTTCDEAKEVCPLFQGAKRMLH
jgi:arsenate reductase